VGFNPILVDFDRQRADQPQSARVGEITPPRLRHSAATILLNHVGKDLREIQELLPHKNIAPPCAIPTSAMSRLARPPRRSAKLCSEVGDAFPRVIGLNVPNNGHLWQFDSVGKVIRYDHITDTAQMIRMANGE
jgi:hypothetical protein